MPLKMRKTITPFTAGIVLAAAFLVILQMQTGAPILQGSLQDGLGIITGNVTVPTDTDSPREAIETALQFLISFLGLAAVVAIVISGFVLVTSFGSEAAVTRGRKIFLYAILGVLVVFFVTVIVSFFSNELPESFSS